METPRWNIITPSQYEHERRALDFIRAGLPDHDPYRAWSNFEFVTSDGAIYEVDLLVLTKQGFFLVEIKSWPGRVRGDAGTWTRTTPEGRVISEDNPVLLVNRKAKALSSLLKSQSATKKIHVPWLDAIVFLSADDLHCDLTGPAANRVFLKDRKASDSQKERKGILAALMRREGQGIDPELRSTIDTKVARALAKAARAFFDAVEGQEPTPLVKAIAKARIETSGKALGRSIKSAATVLASLLQPNRWELFEAVSEINDRRKTDATLLIDDLRDSLMMDEFALAGGLPAKLSDAEGRAVKLLRPPKVEPPTTDPPPIPPMKPGWKRLDSGSTERMSGSDLTALTEKLAGKLGENSRRRVTIQWTLEEESE